MAGWLFLAAALVGALLVVNIYRPIRPNVRLGFLSFFLGWLEAELAVHHILWQGIATAIFLGFGALESPAGQLALGVTLVSWAALGFHYLRGFAVRGAVERALAEGLGAGYEERIPPEVRERLSRRVDWLAVAAPFPVSWRHPEVERIRNVRYGRAGAVDLKLDVYRRRDLPAGRHPVLFYVHGGGWVIGTKDTQGLPLVYHMASRGWVCVNVNYRLSPHATFPDHLVDLKRALQWVRKEGPAYGADPDFVVATGGSAGGHLAAMLALTPNDPELQPGFEDADTRVQGCVPIYGVYDFTGIQADWRHEDFAPFLERHVMKARYEDDPTPFQKASPVHRVGSDAPPFFVVHGAEDTLVPVGEARAFVAALRGAGASPVAYAEIPGAQHAFELFPSLRSILTRHGIERFLAALWAEHRTARD
ncbi:MAG: alpha/beta hydrolase fold domain-containing protein [Myxococcota bacterium]